MIQVLHGDRGSARAACRRVFAATAAGLWLEEAVQLRRCWWATRQLLPQIRAARGDGPVEEALARHRVIASLVLGGLRERLDAEERRELEATRARLTSHLTHNWYLDRPIMQGVAALLADAMAGGSGPRLTVFMPDLSSAHPQTIALLVILHRLFPASAPNLVVGYDSQAESHFVDQHGLAWGIPAEISENLLRAIRALGTVVDEAVEGEREEAAGPAIVLDRWDDDFDGQAFARLDASDCALDTESTDLVLTAARRAFEAFSRDVSVLLATRLLTSGSPLDQEARAEAHTIAGLSAHNWQFETRAGNPRLTEFLEYHFRRALELETDPVRRLALRYRLAVTIGRRRKDFAAAKQQADLGIEEAQAPEIPRADRLYHETWIRNIRAYLLMRQGDLKGAFADSEWGLDRIDELQSLRQDRDSRYTRTTLADNNLTLCKISGDEARLYRRVRANMGFLEDDPESYGGRFSAGAWIQLYREKHRLDMAIRCARYGLEDAGDTYIHFRWYYLSQLADLHYRRGDATSALEYFERTLDCRRYLRPVQDMVFLGLPVAAWRAGQIDRATAELERALGHPDAAALATRAEIHGMLANAWASVGDSARAEELINGAIQLAVESGIRDVLVEVARYAAAVAVWLGDRGQAAAACRRGLEIAAQGESLAPAGSVAALLGSLIVLDAGEPQHYDRLLALTPEALLHDSELWWQLPELVPRVAEELSRRPDLGSDGFTEAIGALHAAASQRPDCAAGAAALGRVMPASVLEEALVV